MPLPAQAAERLSLAKRIWLFLDYDGTLAEFAPTPDHVTPDTELIELLSSLNAHPRLQLAIVSGRALSQLRTLLPIPGLLIAGTYGIETLLPDGEIIHRATYARIRPSLDHLKPRWRALLADRQGYFLEDKGWAIALHARFAAEIEASDILRGALLAASEAAVSPELRILYGYKFLEVGPKLAHKGHTVSYLLEQYFWDGALPVYIGDDDKDEEAFKVINQYNGISIVVCPSPRETNATIRLQSPRAVREWLAQLLHA